MARPLRVQFPGAIYHITSRGNAGLPIFADDIDRHSLLLLFQETFSRFNWLCYAYCLMDNHYHLLVETVDGNLSQGMRHLNGVYTQRHNRRNSRTGHVFQGRYKSILVERESYLLELCRYVVLNPVRAGMVKQPENYSWSSYRVTAGLDKKPSFLATDWILAQFAGQRHEAREQYREFVLAGIKEPSPWSSLKSKVIIGGREFIEKIAPWLKDSSEMTEIPKRERLASRPPLDDLFHKQTITSRDRRNEAIVTAHLQYGYSLAEIGNHLGLHYTTISKVVRPGLS